MQPIDSNRRHLPKWLGAAGGLFAVNRAAAHHTDTHWEDRSTHQIVYQCNKIDPDYLEHIMFSVGEMVRKYGDDIQVIVTAFGPGLHLLLKHPMRPVAPLIVRTDHRMGDAVVLGRSNIVGKPIANMMVQKGPGANSTVTMVHTRTKDLADHCK